MNDSDLVEYTISVNIPDEFRTRAAATATLGESGLYEFEQRTIDKLWYCMYYDGVKHKQGEVTREDNNPFTITYRFDLSQDPSKVWFFFWAGNSEDNVVANGVGSQSSINLNYDNKCVNLTTRVLNGSINNTLNLKYYDSFTGYYQLTTSNDLSQKSASFILKRPFAQIHVLGDDFIPEISELYKDYTEGAGFYAGLSSSVIKNRETATSTNTKFCFPTTWYYDDNRIVCKEAAGSDLLYFYNDLTGTSQRRTELKDRKLDYYTCFCVLAPKEAKPYSIDDKPYNILYLRVKNGTNKSLSYNDSGSDRFINIQLPEEGLKANNIYVIYDKARKDGGTGFLDGYFDWEISVNHDGSWETPNVEQASDRLTE